MSKKLDDIIAEVKGLPRKRLVVACGEDHHTIEAVFRASSEGLVDVIMVGNKKKMEEVAANHGVNPSTFTIVDIEDNRVALKQAVKLVREGKGIF